MITFEAICEQVEMAFIEEVGGRFDLLSDPDATAEILAELLDYVMVTQGIDRFTVDERAVVQRAQRDLFGFGALVALIGDERITELSIDGRGDLSQRIGAGTLTPLDSEQSGITPPDGLALERLITNSAALVGIDLAQCGPLTEFGIALSGRPARLTVARPPASQLLNVGIRLHPRQVNTLESCIASGMLTPAQSDKLQMILAEGYGMLIAGEVGSGKTTLLEALLNALPAHTTMIEQTNSSICVERAAELRVPATMNARVASPMAGRMNFTEKIQSALQERPSRLILDELQFDESEAVWAALIDDAQPALLWVVRGSQRPDRLRSAFNVMLRRAVPDLEQDTVDLALTDRLPYLVTMTRGLSDNGLPTLRVGRIARWESNDNGLILSDVILPGSEVKI